MRVRGRAPFDGTGSPGWGRSAPSPVHPSGPTGPRTEEAPWCKDSIVHVPDPLGGRPASGWPSPRWPYPFSVYRGSVHRERT